jgi:hypothetical protein
MVSLPHGPYIIHTYPFTNQALVLSSTLGIYTGIYTSFTSGVIYLSSHYLIPTIINQHIQFIHNLIQYIPKVKTGIVHDHYCKRNKSIQAMQMTKDKY